MHNSKEKRYHLSKVYVPEPKQYGDISLIQIGRMHCTPYTVVDPHFHQNWFELTVVTDGCGIVGTNGEDIRVRAGDIYLSFPRDFHVIRSDQQDPLKYNFFSFTTEEPSLLQELEEIIRTRYPVGERLFSDERIVYQLGNAIAELSAPTPRSQRILETNFLLIVLYLLDDYHRKESAPSKTSIGHPEEVCFQMMHYIDTHLYTMRSLREITDSLNYSYCYLSDLFRQITGDTLQSYYRTRRLEAARLLIREGKMKVGEIAALLQYSSIYTFSRAFREQYGVSPTDMRKPE